MKLRQRFSIKTALCLFVVVAFLFSWIEHRKVGLKTTEMQVENLGGYVVLDSAFDSDGSRLPPTKDVFSNSQRSRSYFLYAFREAAEIVFRGTGTSDADLGFLPSVRGLKHVDLCDTRITTDCFSVFSLCKSLETVTVSAEQIPEDAVKEFNAACPDCELIIEGLEFSKLNKLIDGLVE